VRRSTTKKIEREGVSGDTSLRCSPHGARVGEESIDTLLVAGDEGEDEILHEFTRSFLGENDARKPELGENDTNIASLSESEHYRVGKQLFPFLLHYFPYTRYEKKVLNVLHHPIFFFPLADLGISQTIQNEHDFGVLASNFLPDLGDTEKIMLVLGRLR
jgi:hypothetical protein